jgi:large subunit ribosomal protein L30
MKLKVKLVRSPIGRLESQKKTLKALGLRKLNQVVIKENSPSIKGMIRKVSHLVEVEEVSD